MTMARFLRWISAFCRKFFHEGVPVALAGAIGTFLVNEYNNRQQSAQIQPPPPIVVPAPLPSPAFNVLGPNAPEIALPPATQAIAEPKRVENVAQEKPTKQSHTVTVPKKLTLQRSEWMMEKIGEPLQLQPAPPSVPASADRPVDNKSGTEHHFGRTLGEWLHNATRIPELLPSAVGDVPRPPMSLPLVQHQIGPAM
jgi:hypothetical protein